MNRRKINRAAAIVAVSAAFATAAAACSGSGPGKPSASKAASNSNGMAAWEFNEFCQAVPYPYASCDGSNGTPPSDPLERKNLSKRLTQYNSKGDTNYVYVFTYTGQVIGYYVINGKVSSTSSQMTSTQVNVGCGSKSPQDQCTNEAIGDDGSYGPEEGGQAGVFFFTVNGTLEETDLPFLVSSAPVAIYASVPNLDAPVKK